MSYTVKDPSRPWLRSCQAINVGYKRGRLSSTIGAPPVTEAYREGMSAMGWDWGDGKQRDFCTSCDRPLAWCECQAKGIHG